MQDIANKIQSIRQAIGGYKLPNPEILEEYKKALSTNQLAIDYLKNERGLTDETIKNFQLGYCASRDAISIPIFKNGVLVNMKYRLLSNPNQRYSGEPEAESWVFNESGIDEGRKKGAILLVEGEIDAMTVWQAGIKNVISPSGGKDSTGIWLEMVDKIPKIFLAFDNDNGGKESSNKLADRLGTERTHIVNYGDVKDANEYFQKHTVDEFKTLLKSTKPAIGNKFQSIGDVINILRKGVDESITTKFVPKVKFQKGWMAVVSGVSNIGKTSYVMNIADEFARKGVGVLVLPFERGIESVGTRYLQVHCEATPEDFTTYSQEDWDKVSKSVGDLPVFFAMPSKEEVTGFIEKSKRYFNTQVVIVDHLDYLVRQISGSRGDSIMDTMQQLKRVAEDNGIVLIIVSHIRKIEQAGEFIKRRRKPNIEDLKGSSSLYQDPEVVVMLSEADGEDVLVDVLKNKGEMANEVFHFNRMTGVYGDSKGKMTPEIISAVKSANELWEEVVNGK